MIEMRPNVKPDGRYSPVETAKLLGISRRTLYNWIDKGWIKCEYRKLGCKRTFLGSDILSAWEEYY